MSLACDPRCTYRMDELWVEVGVHLRGVEAVAGGHLILILLLLLQVVSAIMPQLGLKQTYYNILAGSRLISDQDPDPGSSEIRIRIQAHLWYGSGSRLICDTDQHQGSSVIRIRIQAHLWSGSGSRIICDPDQDPDSSLIWIRIQAHLWSWSRKVVSCKLTLTNKPQLLQKVVRFFSPFNNVYPDP